MLCNHSTHIIYSRLFLHFFPVLNWLALFRNTEPRWYLVIVRYWYVSTALIKHIIIYQTVWHIKAVWSYCFKPIIEKLWAGRSKFCYLCGVMIQYFAWNISKKHQWDADCKMLHVSSNQIQWNVWKGIRNFYKVLNNKNSQYKVKNHLQWEPFILGTKIITN